MIVLDTHTWVWWASGTSNLSSRARREIDGAPRIGVAAISLWEVALKASRATIGLNRPVEAWIDQALALPRVELLPLDAAVAVRSTRLPAAYHGDPADRLIVATALVHRAPLVSKDAKIRKLEGLDVIW